ncbi:hypothetical protein BDW74DRAFT_143214 [Aspergillus multicolor]|uniref:uncharacterized protein n=1 Tax=Aspergillus multicolor TaxID=41759 RepID=UPI003CCCCF47
MSRLLLSGALSLLKIVGSAYPGTTAFALSLGICRLQRLVPPGAGLLAVNGCESRYSRKMFLFSGDRALNRCD